MEPPPPPAPAAHALGAVLDQDATAQAALIARGEIAPSELVEAAIARVEARNPALNAVIRPLFDEARALVDPTREPALPPPGAPFRGVPFLVKDGLAQLRGVPTTGGSRYFQGRVAPHDSTLVARYRAAGLVILGRTNMPEMGLEPVTDPAAYGPTRNPWDLTRTPGGSSGGSAAAVAAGLVPMAHGNDGGGSLRIPASCSGLFALKPTRGRTTLGPDVGALMGGLVEEHALTRSVRDSAALLDAAGGPSPGDPYPAPAKRRPYAAALSEPPPPLRVALWLGTPHGNPVAPVCRTAAQETAALLEELGHAVEEAPPPLDPSAVIDAFYVIWAAGAAGGVASFQHLTGRAPKPGDLEPHTAELVEVGRSLSAARYMGAQMALQLYARRMAQHLTAYDVLLTPTLAEPPLLVGTLAAEPTLRGAFDRAVRFSPWTWYANITGQPAMSVPLTWVEVPGAPRGLPLGSHFLGRYGDEELLFRLAAQLEAARPWSHRRPLLGVTA